MYIVQSRRDFLAGLSLAGAAGTLVSRSSLADQGLLETTTIRLYKSTAVCLAPLSVAGELLRAEGFTDVRYIPQAQGFTGPQMAGRGEIDLGMVTAPSLPFNIDGGVPIVALSGVHSGCYELFAHEPIWTISDLKGKRVGIARLTTDGHLYVAIMAANVGLDPHKDIEWVTSSTGNAMELFAEGKVDAYLAFPPEPQVLRARKIGRAILKTTFDRPWSQYFCCMIYGNRSFVREHPVATKRAIRAILKTADICAAEPEWAVQRLVEGGFTKQYDYALEALSEVPYGRWREFDPEDTLRFLALRLHEVGMIQSSPKQIIAEGTDWRFLNEIKRELKA